MNKLKEIIKILVVAVVLFESSHVSSEQLQAISITDSSNATNFQKAIDKILPGYEILKNEDFLQDESILKNFLSDEEIESRKERKNPGFIIGKFNNDDYEDFAAFVISRSISKEYQYQAGETKVKMFSSRLVICLGSKIPNTYKCDVLPTNSGNDISLPFWVDMKTIHGDGEEVECGDPRNNIIAYYPEGWHGKRPETGWKEVPAIKLLFKYDAIVENDIGSVGGRVLFRTTNGLYLNCSTAD